jgi:hypothetical protein
LGISLVRLPAHNVDVIIYAGRISRDDGMRFYNELDVDDPALSSRWITWIDADVDFSDVPVTAYPQVKQILGPKLNRLSKRPEFCSAIVCNSPHCQIITHFWCDYVDRDPEYVSRPVLFTKLGEACDWLKLSSSGCAAVAQAVLAQQRAVGEPRQGVEAH